MDKEEGEGGAGIVEDAAHICVNFVFLYQLSWLSVWHAIWRGKEQSRTAWSKNLSNASDSQSDPQSVQHRVHLQLYMWRIRAIRMPFAFAAAFAALLIETEFIGSA